MNKSDGSMNDDDILNLKKTFANEDTVLARNIVRDCEIALEDARTPFGAECKEEARQRCFAAIRKYHGTTPAPEKFLLVTEEELQVFIDQSDDTMTADHMTSVALELQEYRKAYGPLCCSYLTRSTK